jgi:hypothetical protein
MEIVDFEFIPIEELENELVYEFDSYDENDEFEVLDEISVTLAVAEILEETFNLA